MSRLFSFLFLLMAFASCHETATISDAYGNFETTATLISAEANGQLLFLRATEGKPLKEGELVALVDTTQLHLQREQIKATIGTLPQKLQTSLADIEVLKDQKANLIRERDRVQRLLEKKAATPKQLDDLTGEITVMEQRIQSVQTKTNTANRGILSEKGPLLAQVEIINEKIRQSYVFNPVAGTVLTKLAEPFEMVMMGSPLYRIAQLDTMTLRVYADAVQLQGLKLGNSVEVLIDNGADGFTNLSGKISWIAEQAEFTPKTIQTKEERVNLVYAVKIKVPNPDGFLKMGMPAEVNFSKKTPATAK